MQVDPRAPELVTEDFVAMVNAAPYCVLIHDAATKNILWANPAACALLEFSLTEIRPLKANDMSSSAQQYDRVIGRAWLQDAVEHGISRIEWHYRSRSGRVIPTDAFAVRVDLAQGPAVMVQFRDIEREQQIENELRVATSYIDALARHTSTVAFILDGSGTIRFATDSALQHLGLSGECDPPLGNALTAYARFVLGGNPAPWTSVAAAAVPVSPLRLEVRRAAGTSVWLEGSVEWLPEQETDAYLLILHDVSNRVRDEKQRDLELRHENHLARYNAMGDMAMAVAHELGQPLAAASNFLAGARAGIRTLAEHHPERVAQVEYGVSSAVRQIDRVATIVSALRAFVGHLEHVQQIVDLNDVVAECLYFIELRARAHHVRVDVQVDPMPLPVRCERVLTGQVVMNLCFNAIDEMSHVSEQNRVLLIETARQPDSAVLTVSDRGRGLDRNPFDESFTSKEHGSGIGLALSHRIITRQHGSIWGEHREGGGASFGFALPLAPALP
jgi:PAS domain S-box-containing protein